MLKQIKVFAIIVFTFTITHTTVAANEEETQSGAHIPYEGFGATDSPQTYYFGYDSKVKDAPRLMREEKRLSDGTVTGRYGYTDPFGVFRVVKYVSGNGGYYATEEIGEYVTSSTPQYYKATAPQMESVSEEPINYSVDLATKFNPPLYHPEAHTMAPYEEQPSSETDGRGYGRSGPSDESKGHGIFSLSNSEDILERKYRERKQLEKSMRTTQNQNQNRANSVPKQTFDRRIGYIPPNYETPIERTGVQNSDTIRANIDRNIDNKDIIESFVDNNSNNELLRRTALQSQTDNYRHLIDNNYTDFAIKSNISVISNISNRSNSDNRNYNIEVEVKKVETPHTNKSFNVNKTTTGWPAFTASPVPETAQPVSPLNVDPDHDSHRHLYYNPTRTPITSFSTQVTNDLEINVKNKSESETQNNFLTKLRERFLYGSPTTEPSVPTTTSENPITTTTLSTDNDRENETNYEVFSPVFIRVDPQVIRTLPLDISEDQEPKFFDKNWKSKWKRREQRGRLEINQTSKYFD